MTDQEQPPPPPQLPQGQDTEGQEALVGSGFLAKGIRGSIHRVPPDQGLFASMEPKASDATAQPFQEPVSNNNPPPPPPPSTAEDS
jgi:hypothetical protein